jgi:hypothetical protein
VFCAVPPFDPTSGLLPSGEHPSAWGEVLERFGWNLVRRRLLDGLAEGLSILADAGCTRVWLNGSFVTAKAFFQFDRDGTSKGIVVIDPSKEIWE